MFTKGGREAFANNISETEMFTFFDMAVVEYVKSEFNTYDLVHCNDWHTGLITHLLNDELGLERPATVFTIHNLLYQGKGGVDLVKDVGIYPGEHRLIDWDVSDGDLNLILQGITSSDYVNTVSPTYAREIVTQEFGKELSEVIKNREGRLTGILNGIDYSQFPRNYDAGNHAHAKKGYKENVQKELKLENFRKPTFAFISRLDANQKGLDILIKIVPEIVKNGGQFVLLGTGDKTWEENFAELNEKEDLRGNVSVNVKFDVALANQIYAASDFLLVPSKYEPCGLIQMIGMWYGSLPIVHEVGGLKDSVTDGVNGFSFDTYSSGRLLSAVQRAFKVYGTHLMDSMIENAMKTDFSWDKSALEYKILYEKVVHSPYQDKDIEDLPQVQNVRIMRAFLNRVTYYNSQDKEVMIFNNRGGKAGASILHPHSQIVALKGFPGIIEMEKTEAMKYYNEHNSCYWCDKIKVELALKKRIVHETPHFVLLVPVACRWSYEMLLIPKEHKPNFGYVNDMEINDLTQILKAALWSYNAMFNKPDRNFWIHTMKYEPYHWHVGFIPHIKVFGGLELGAGIWVSDKAAPEDAAEQLGENVKTCYREFIG